MLLPGPDVIPLKASGCFELGNWVSSTYFCLTYQGFALVFRSRNGDLRFGVIWSLDLMMAVFFNIILVYNFIVFLI